MKFSTEELHELYADYKSQVSPDDRSVPGFFGWMKSQKPAPPRDVIIRRFELRQGPHDGAVVWIEESLPIMIFVGRQSFGGCRTAWRYEQSAEFPLCYVIDMATDTYTLLS